MKALFNFYRFLKKGLIIFFITFFPLTVFAGSWQNNVSIAGFNNVNIYTPDSNSSIGNGKALLIVLHGCTQSISSFLTANLETAADEHGMVIAVPDAMNKAGFSCWSYWQGTKSRNSGDYKNLISLATVLTTDTGRNIDANQVYIAGLSSGAAFANTTACIAPDIFAGMGISAGPSIGTSSSGAIGNCEAADVKARCIQYSGQYSSHLDSQIASIAHGDNDTTVSQCYNTQNAEGMAAVYNAVQLNGTSSISEEGGRTAEETLWKDGRVSMLWLNNAAHAWSGGAGASGSYITDNSINYAAYLGRYFKKYNQRVSRNSGPTITELSSNANSNQIIVSGIAIDQESRVASVNVTINKNDVMVATFQTTVDSNNAFSVESEPLENGLYSILVSATDDQGASSKSLTISQRIGPPPPPSAPVLSNINATVTQQCVTVSGQVTDENLDLVSVTVTIENKNPVTTVEGDSFQATQCNLTGGNYNATITATDATDLSSSDSIAFSIDAGMRGNYQYHIDEGHITWGIGYATCYLEYGTSEFTMFEQKSGEQCRWEDEDASCAGPLVTCRTGTPSTSCQEYSTANYYHKLSGRAFSSGVPFSPDYFAMGSNTPMPGSTWGITTLHSTEAEIWQTGNCR